METKEQIIEIANNLLIERGFNAFSYKTISEEINIKTSSIHYHFPTKSDLGVAVICKHHEALEQTIIKTKNKTPLEKINKLFNYYKRLAEEQKVCIVGALISDINTMDEPLRKELLCFATTVVNWVAAILEEGQKQKLFKPIANTRLKAKLVMTNLMALVQIARIEKNKQSFAMSTQVLLDELILK